MLPTDRPLTIDEIERVARDFAEFTAANKIGLETVSKSLGRGFSAAVLSSFRNNKAKRGGAERIARGVNEWMERTARRAEVERPRDFVESEVSQKILQTIRLAIEHRTMASIVGCSGVGKTMTLQAARAAYTGSLYIRVMQSTRRGPGLATAFAKQLGVTLRNNFESRQLGVIEALRGTDRPVLVDEAHQMALSGWEFMRDIHDETGVPVVFVGTIAMFGVIDDASVMLGQFARRIILRLDVTEQARHPKNPRPLFSVDEILAMFQSDQVRLTDDGAGYLTDVANTLGCGSLGLCRQLVNVASRLRRLQGKPIDAKTLRQVFSNFHGREAFAATEARTRARVHERLEAIA